MLTFFHHIRPRMKMHDTDDHTSSPSRPCIFLCIWVKTSECSAISPGSSFYLLKSACEQKEAMLCMWACRGQGFLAFVLLLPDRVSLTVGADTWAGFTRHFSKSCHLWIRGCLITTKWDQGAHYAFHRWKHRPLTMSNMPRAHSWEVREPECRPECQPGSSSRAAHQCSPQPPEQVAVTSFFIY